MNWQEVVENPVLRDLPFKIELNERGEIIMSPVKLHHSAYQGRINHLMETYRQDGISLVECAIDTRKGTKAADVAWYSWERWEKVEKQASAKIAPEVCVEVMSKSNTDDEIKEKRKLYFEKGAKEVWVCKNGKMSFYSPKRKLKRSILFPDFPAEVGIKRKP
jgi:Uma2 family endonuclease